MKNPLTLRRPIVISVTLLLLIMLGGLWLIASYLQLERERDLADWSIRLSMIAEDRAANIEQMLAHEFSNLDELANNASLQMYLSQLATQTNTPADIEPAQLGYLRNLLNAAAERGGFRASETLIPANLPSTSQSGLALINNEGKVVVVSSGMPALDAEDRALALYVISSGKPALRDLRVSTQGQASIGFIVPVSTLQGMQDKDSPRRVGVLLGIKNAATDLYPLLANRGSLTRHDETLLVKLDNNVLINLSPLADGSAPLQRRLPLSSLDENTLRVLQTPGQFSRGRDYRGAPVLMTSRSLSNAPWILIQKTDSNVALKESDDHRNFLLTAFLLTLFFISASLVAAWRHGSSVRAQAMTARLQEKTRMLEGQTRLLHGVTDTLSDYLFLLDEGHRLIFANRALEAAIGVAQADLFGKTLASIFGPDTAQQIENRIDTPSDESKQPENLTVNDREGLYQCSALPLPNPAGSGHATLVVLHDVTALHESERKRANLLHQLIAALMRAVDKHDPHSANHSSRTAAVAVAIGRELGLPESDLQALDLAANLANVGKIFIPKEVLTKSGALSDAEQETLKQHVQYALDILSSLEFEGPVLATIAQKQELMDGSGYPHGLRGEAIILTARILAVANAFVALVSPRAYRDAAPTSKALDQLLTESKDKYDRHVVAALFHISENRDDLTSSDM